MPSLGLSNKAGTVWESITTVVVVVIVCGFVAGLHTLKLWSRLSCDNLLMLSPDAVVAGTQLTPSSSTAAAAALDRPPGLEAGECLPVIAPLALWLAGQAEAEECLEYMLGLYSVYLYGHW